jgi:hypothetical protein
MEADDPLGAFPVGQGRDPLTRFTCAQEAEAQPPSALLPCRKSRSPDVPVDPIQGILTG